MTIKRFLISAGIVLAFIIVVGTIGWMDNQQNNVQNLESRLNQLQNNLDERMQANLDSLKEELTNTIQQQNSNVFNVSYITTDYDKAKNLAKVTIKFQLKNYKKGNSVQVFYHNSNNTSSNPVNAILVGDIFQADLFLDLNANDPYSVCYSITSENIINEKIVDIDLIGELYGRFKIHVPNISFDKKKQKINFTMDGPEIRNFYQPNEKLKLIKCIIEVYNKNELIKTFDVTNQLQCVGDGQSFISDENTSMSFALQEEENSQYDDLSNISCKISATDGYGIHYDFN